MTPNKYRCETCEKYPCADIKAASATISSKIISDMIMVLLKEFTSKVGCTSHSSFLNAEQWIADAVEELRKLGNRESKRAYEVSDRCRQCYCDGVAKGCQTAISLLQEVKK
jgi:hypothetical protein